MVRKEHERHLERLKAMAQDAGGKHGPIDPDFLLFDKEFAALAPAPRWVDGGHRRVDYPDGALEYYGRPYSQREYFELAMRRALEKRGCYSAEELEERLQQWMELFEEWGPLDTERTGNKGAPKVDGGRG